MNAVIILTSLPANFDARPIIRELVEQHLAACVNIVSGVLSTFRWKGNVEEDPEQLLVIKTVAANVDALRDALLQRHPYEVAEFVVVPVAAMSDAYSAWLLESTTR